MTAFREQNLPERALMRPDDSDGFREAWSILERRAGPGWSTSRSRNVSASFSTEEWEHRLYPERDLTSLGNEN